MNKNQVMLYKLSANFKDDAQNNLAMAMTTQHMLMTYGYMLDENAFAQLKKTDTANIVDFYNECEVFLKEHLGGKHEYKSLYSNFPNDILSMSQSELFYNQILHYWTACTFIEVGKPKDSAFEHVTYKVIKGVDSIIAIYTKLASSGQSLTPMDQKVLKYFATEVNDLPFVDVPFKENLAILASILPTFKVKTVVDVLRIAVGFSGGDVSLPAIPKKLKKKGAKYDIVIKERNKFNFKLKPKQIETIMNLFENSNLSLSDLNQGSRYNRFIRLAEVLKVQQFENEYPKTYNAFKILRNQKRKGKPDGFEKIRTWNSHVNTQFKVSFEAGIIKLSERPGEFLRRLDSLVRQNQKNQTKLDLILVTLSRIGEASSNKVLFEVYTHFENRIKPVTNRSIFIKGARNRKTLPNLPAIQNDIVIAIQDTIINCIKYKMALLPNIGSCYVDEELKKIPLPTNMRSLSESLTPQIRGQRTPIGDSKVVRPYIHWFDENGNEDLDLHAFLIGDKNSVSVGYNGVHNSKFGLYSGDVRHRRGACAEYIDIDFDIALKHGYDYLIMVVHNFQQRPLSTMKDCVSGFMLRDNPKQNHTWLPETITNAIKLTSEAQMCLIGAYDIKTKEYIHLDLDFNTFSRYINGSSSTELMKAIEPYIVDPKLSIYDLLTWHVQARGKNSSKDKADTHFMYDDFKSDYTEILPWLGV